MDQGSSKSTRATNRFKSIFSYYGGKARIAHLYPEPTHDTIIEPFCGAAGYSLRHYERKVLLYDSDPVTASIWTWLLGGTVSADIQAYFPWNARQGDRVSAILHPDAPPGMLRLLQSEANAGTQGAKGVHDQITKFGAKAWDRIVPKLEHWVPLIQHWRFHQCDYTAIPNMEGTWFIDPPYGNNAGSRYRTQITDYKALGSWCLDRWGQIIVCENYGADWLPFTPLVVRRGVYSSYQLSRAMEGVYVAENQFSDLSELRRAA